MWKLKELTKRYKHIIRGYGVTAWGAKDFDSKEFLKGLASIRALPTCQGCLKGDGNEECKIRPCAKNRKIPDCNECNEPTTCKNLNELQNVRTGALQVGMIIKTDKDKDERQQLIKKCTAEIKNKLVMASLSCIAPSSAVDWVHRHARWEADQAGHMSSELCGKDKHSDTKSL